MFSSERFVISKQTLLSQDKTPIAVRLSRWEFFKLQYKKECMTTKMNHGTKKRTIILCIVFARARANRPPQRPPQPTQPLQPAQSEQPTQPFQPAQSEQPTQAASLTQTSQQSGWNLLKSINFFNKTKLSSV